VIFTILSLFPELFHGFLESSILSRAIGKGQVDVRVVDIRDFAVDKHRICDDYSYGGGPGMVMKPEPLASAIESVASAGKRVIYLTPAGSPFTQGTAEKLAAEGEIVLVCGRYEGIDQRIIDAFVTDEISIGDYVLSGGEVAAMVVVDAVSRLVEGVITDASLEEESFSGGLLEYPHYTRPEVFRGVRVPEVLRSGHHENIRRWRLERSVEKTLRFRPELLESRGLPEEVKGILSKRKREGDGDGSGKSG
jgi:tRNA (guanine37-N1)-methyltransferase